MSAGRDSTLDVVVASGAELGEGPVWDARTGRLAWVDILGRLPVSRPTSCAFGGPDFEELYVTSASKGLSADARRAEPLAGALFRLRPGVHGVPPSTCRQSGPR